jgi:hypothetical protein
VFPRKVSARGATGGGPLGGLAFLKAEQDLEERRVVRVGEEDDVAIRGAAVCTRDVHASFALPEQDLDGSHAAVWTCLDEANTRGVRCAGRAQARSGLGHGELLADPVVHGPIRPDDTIKRKLVMARAIGDTLCVEVAPWVHRLAPGAARFLRSRSLGEALRVCYSARFPP